MAIIRHSDCVGCAHCVNCGLKSTYYDHYYCDECDDEADRLYWIDDKLICDKCAEEFGIIKEELEEAYING